jgi:type I restriction enzyme S subunit
MMANREMKNSGIPWIGDIPKEWDVCLIKQIMRNKSIKGFPNERVLSLYRDYGVIPKDSRDDNHNVTSDDTSSYKLVDEGDFVINKMKAWQGSMAVSKYRGIISPAYYICRFTTDKIDKEYIHHLLRNETYKVEYMRLSSGLRIGQWDLNIDDFLRIKMVLPPIVEQQAIAEYLDTKCTEIDNLISIKLSKIDSLKDYKKSIIYEYVTGKKEVTE